MANTIYQPTFLQPELISVDLSVNQNFTCIVDGTTIDSYQLIIYNNSTGLSVYDSTKVALGSPLFNDDTLSVELIGGTLPNGVEYKWTMTYWNGIESVVSYETLFAGSTTATLTIAVPGTINAQEFEFIGTYTQIEGVSIREWYYVLYDSLGVEIERTNISFSGDIRHTFSGLVSGVSLKIQGFLVTQENAAIESPVYSFGVSYSTPILEITPTVTTKGDLTANLVEWGALSQITGSLTSGTGSYIENFLYAGNWGFQLDTGAILEYNISLGAVRSWHNVWVPNSTAFSGKIAKLSNSGNSDYYEVGYDSGAFYADLNGDKRYGSPIALDNLIFIIVITGNTTIIRGYYEGGTFGYLEQNFLFGDLISFTWGEVQTLGT